MTCCIRRAWVLLTLPALALVGAPLPAQTQPPIKIGFLLIDGASRSEAA